ncbi:hypothetical protein P153DRAFT_329857 [Dothidotthia symphoricarpi CBS 119687]|uniref:Homeobox domain-containing protein n=1 Tax=Dothidotthia symphoricarpi CBS 119687 TaxID=1392245 RepID=A0A6A6ATF8_9PLEO|nr:uncharacterized protein P153DRAFT_329857 [Dothidotthia symphoricarpi CBS 119687]KAF2134950.1 hypothetical protein P153DRAFT_329857 [Dothidotthia symphoricarpi CBS 119687]
MHPHHGDDYPYVDPFRRSVTLVYSVGRTTLAERRERKAHRPQNRQGSTPPVQSGEQHFAARLPSFTEFLHTTRVPTPPRTPSRQLGSAPTSPPKFDDIAWQDPGRRRHDTLGDIYARSSNHPEYSSRDPRRSSSAIDPALISQYSLLQIASNGTSPQDQQHHHHQRSSVPYPAHTSTVSHGHQPTSPGSQAYATYHMGDGLSSSAPVHPSMFQMGGGPVYAVARPSYQPGYPSQPYDVQFHQHIGHDPNAFTRKRRGNLPKEATNRMKEWFAANRVSPYPTEDQKLAFCHQTGLSMNQVSNWFINARRRAPQKEQREREAKQEAKQG